MSQSPQGSTKRPWFFYGWYIIGVTGLAGAFAGGTSQAFFGLFVRPIGDDTGWSRTAIAGAITLATFVGGALSALAGRLADRMGPRALMAVGTLVYGVAFLGMILVTQVWHLYAAYFAARIASLHLLSGVVPRTAAVNWFRRKRGRALGLQNTAMPLGGALLSAVAGALLAAGLDWRDVFALIGGTALVLLMVPVALVMRRQPEDMGLLPDGDTSPPAAAPEADGPGAIRRRARGAAGPERSWTLREALRTRALWLVGIGTMLHALASGGISFHLPAYYTDLELGTGIAAAAAAIFLFSGALSSTVWGYLTEHFDERLLVVVGTSAAVVLTFNGRFISEPVGALAFAAAYGATTRGEGALVMMMLAAYYGRRSFGAISGVVGTFSFVGLALGPIIYSRMFDVSGSYDDIFVTSTVILAVAAVMLWLAKRPTPPVLTAARGESLMTTGGRIIMASPSDIETLKQQVADSSHILDHQGLVDFHGHVSARIPGTNSILIKPVLRPHNQIEAKDIVTVDMAEYMAADQSQWDPSKQQGRVIDAPVPPRETMLHVASYQHRPDVNSVVHTHQLVATSIGTGNVAIKPLYNQALAFAPETPIYQRPDLITNLDLGNEVAETLGDRNALLLRGHGVLVVGESVDHAVSNTIYLERTAIMQVIATIVGKPEALDDDYVAKFLPDWNRRASHAYEYFRSLVPSLGSRG